MDYALCLAGAVIAIPLVGALAVLTVLFSGRPIFYKSKRIGRNGRVFFAWKFRTMVPNADELLGEVLSGDSELRTEWQRNTKLQNDPRVTKFGAWLRRSGLDELPQLYNVLRRDMSLVGPRPLLPIDREKYGDAFEAYASALPGMTGLWQVSGRSRTTYSRRMMLDISYTADWSPWLDLCLLARTVPVVLRAEDGF